MLGWRTGTASAGGRLAGLRSSLLSCVWGARGWGFVVGVGGPRAVGEGADLDGARCCRFETLGAERPHQAHDAEAGAEALFGMRPAFQDQLAERRRGGGRRAARS